VDAYARAACDEYAWTHRRCHRHADIGALQHPNANRYSDAFGDADGHQYTHIYPDHDPDPYKYGDAYSDEPAGPHRRCHRDADAGAVQYP
jgi:hypothetical protein